MKKIVYVSTYHSAFWRMPVSRFLQLCREGYRKGVVDVSKFGTRLQRRPRGFTISYTRDDHRRYNFCRDDAKWYDVTDFTKADFAAANSEVLDWMRKG